MKVYTHILLGASNILKIILAKLSFCVTIGAEGENNGEQTKGRNPEARSNQNS